MFQNIMAVEVITVNSQESSLVVNMADISYSVKNVALGSGLEMTA